MAKDNLVEDNDGRKYEEEADISELQLEVSSLNQADDVKDTSRSATATSRCSTYCIDLKSIDNEAQNETTVQNSSVVADTKEALDQETEVLARNANNQCNAELYNRDVAPSCEPIPRSTLDTAETTICQRCKSRNDSSNGCRCRSTDDSRSLRLNLLHSSRDLLKLKDFRSEVRASMDVEQFVHQSEVMLDLTEVSVEEIVVAMLKKVGYCLS